MLPEPYQLFPNRHFPLFFGILLISGHFLSRGLTVFFSLILLSLHRSPGILPQTPHQIQTFLLLHMPVPRSPADPLHVSSMLTSAEMQPFHPRRK